MMRDDLAKIEAAGWRFPAFVWDKLSPSERTFALLEFSGARQAEFYRQRVRAIGFTSSQRVLDAGCGMGQWSLALAEVNSFVEGLDLNDDRLWVATHLCLEAGRSNCAFGKGSMEDLPFPAAAFDLVFCYGAFMFTNMPKTLSEFGRVLRPGGRLYLNANTYGWYAHLIIDRGIRARNWSLVRQASQMVWRTFAGHTAQMLVREAWLRELLDLNGFGVIALDSEGHLNLGQGNGRGPLPGYPKTFYGLRSIIEVVAVRLAS
jgi:SAM-dependent methyltransferase